MERNSNGSKPTRRRAIRLKFDPSSDNRIVLDNRNVVKIDRSKSSSVMSQVDIRTTILEKAHSIHVFLAQMPCTNNQLKSRTANE